MDLLYNKSSLTLGSCPRGWREWDGFCYQIDGAKSQWKTWTDADNYCSAMGAQHVKIERDSQRNFVNSVLAELKAANAQDMWIGVSDKLTDNVFKWSDGTTAVTGYTKWGTDEPKTVDNRYDCGFMNTEIRALDYYTVRQGDCLGQDISGHLDVNKEQCAELCNKQVGGARDCVGFIYSLTVPKHCWLKHTSCAVTRPLRDTQMHDKIANPDPKWYTGYCFNRKPFMCQIPIHQTLKPTTSPPVEYACAGSPDWKVIGNVCFLKVTERKTRPVAQDDCVTRGGNLATIRNADEQSFISNMITETSYIGFNDITDEGTFVWQDGSSSTFLNWGPGEPNNAGNEDCAEVVSPQWGKPGIWNDIPCEREMPYLCSKPAYHLSSPPPPPSTTTTERWSPRCGPTWKYDPASDFCYQVNTEQRLTWGESRQECLKAGGDLLSITGVHEQAFVNALLQVGAASGGLAFWIGANDRDLEGGWQWSDGSPFRYWNWNNGEPNNANTGEHCVETNVNIEGRWNDHDCERKFSYLCKKIPDTRTTVTPPPPTPFPQDCTAEPILSGSRYVQDEMLVSSSQSDASHGPETGRISGGCPLGTKLYNGMCYEFFGGSKTYEEAKKHCSAWGGGLATIKDEAENTFITSALEEQFQRTGKRYWYIGLEQDGDSNTFPKWNDGTDVSFSKWNTGEPNNAAEKCTSVEQPSGWNWHDVFCTRAESFICKIPQQPDRGGCWVPQSSDKNQFIAANFGYNVIVKGIYTQGCPDSTGYVTKYKISYMLSTTSKLMYVQSQPGVDAIFDANADQNGVVENVFPKPVRAQIVRLEPQEWFQKISLRWDIMGCSTHDCEGEKLITGKVTVDDQYLTASSSADLLHGPASARLDGLSWSPTSNSNTQYIQADLGVVMRILSVITAGSPDTPQWVTGYTFLYSLNGANFKVYQDPYGSDKILTGNTNQNDQVETTLYSKIHTQYIRIQPESWKGGIALRFDIIGCLPGCDQTALINGPHPVSNDKLTASSFIENHGPSRSRLNTKREGDLRGAWSAAFNDQQQWIQVDLNSVISVKAVSTQGRDDALQWVERYTITHSLDGTNFESYKEGALNVIIEFDANIDNDNERKQFFRSPFTARYVRLHPTKWHERISLRWEIHGCPGPDASQELGCFKDDIANPDLPNEPIASPPGGMDPKLCVNHCFHKGYVYAGIKANLCRCGNRYGQLGASTDCTTRCEGDPDANCGGDNSNTVYSTGLAPTSERCPDFWTPYNDMCYQVRSRRGTWQEGLDWCNQQGGTLATSNSAAVNDFLTGLLADAEGSTHAWIGLNDKRWVQMYEWVDGQPVLYTKWNVGEPNNWRGRHEECVFMYKDTGATRHGRWNDELCDRKWSTVCQTSKKVLPPGLTLPPEPGCMPGWTPWRWSCYNFILSGSTWEESLRNCQGFGGSLIRIDDSAENAWLSSKFASKEGMMFWTDMTDKDNPGTYIWSDGNPNIPYTHWGPNQPDDSTGNCVAFSGGAQTGLWFDDSCSNKNPSVCEIQRTDYTTPPPPSTPLSSLPCAEGWVSYGDNCFQINWNHNGNFLLTWDEALVDCRSKGGDLASFHSEAEYTFIWRNYMIGETNGNYWIGLNTRSGKEGHKWSDGSPVTFTKWADGEPNDYNNAEDCTVAHARAGRWNDIWCWTGRNWICKMHKSLGTPIPTTTAPSPGPPGSCAPDNDRWLRYNDKCYYFSNRTEQFSWYNARRFCQQQGADLVSIHDIQESNFIYSQARPSTGQSGMWIGLNELDSKDGWKWSDGTPNNFQNWDANQPNDFGFQQTCSILTVRSGKWNDDHCDIRFGLICKKYPGGTPAPPTIPPPRPGNCPTDYIEFGDKCFKFFGSKTQRWTWQDARKECHANGNNYDLASISNPLEQAFITTQLKLQPLGAYWTGMCKCRINQFTWVDNSEVTFTNWNRGEPNGGNREECVHVLGARFFAGKWNDARCDANLGYICMTLKQTSIPVPPPTPPNPCPSGFQSYGNSCYKVLTALQSWTNARDACKTESAHLTSITSQYEQAYIYLLMKTSGLTADSVWIGLSDKNVPGTFLWEDNWPVVYTRWDKGQPSFTGGGCVSIKQDSHWKDTWCLMQQPAICKFTTDSPPVPTQHPPGPGMCPDADEDHDWLHFNGYCYFIYHEPDKNFAEADFECHTRNAELASVHSKEEDNFIVAHLREYARHKVYIGFWRGLTEGFVWKDGSPVQFTNWGKNAPSNQTNTGNADDDKNCVEYNPTVEKWFDQVCWARRGYVCKTKALYNTGDTTTKSSALFTTKYTKITLPPWRTTRQGWTWPIVWTTQGQTALPITQGPPTKSSSIGGIIGGVVAGVVVICIIAVAVIFYNKRKSDRPLLKPDSSFENPGYSVTSGTVNMGNKDGSETYT
ncbi:unnamed protein product [Owenia fusiformis]|uniref:Uncharacterized protein n=1 Tax=Owenia fusiformis TaxID=6347 RepID=A0A8J1TXL7_OWEFU|nr:unnamed protein product [Owenia fusiformis]